MIENAGNDPGGVRGGDEVGTEPHRSHEPTQGVLGAMRVLSNVWRTRIPGVTPLLPPNRDRTGAAPGDALCFKRIN